ncbi:helix-turn-helix transcriptional regulator [Streptomyces sp. NPDC046978]|uniref:helix-turn-helix domain-containing protein n=1 Tax=Streptomyces sp. NPDC046978 TaxID=3154704 RepID=UPI0033F6C877
MLRLYMDGLWKKARPHGDTSVAAVAERAGINKSTLHRLAAGSMEPSLNTLWALRQAYGGRLDTFVYDDPHAKRRPAVPCPPHAPGRSRRTRGTT